jgi:hypothetical protein
VATGKWMDASQPQTLQGAILFSYISAALALFTLLFAGPGPYLMLVLLGAAAYGIANERRVAYRAAVALACLYLFAQVVFLIIVRGGFGALLDVLFAGLLVVLLLHPDSRQYERVWFH